jgi:hypothetical protein
MLDSRPLKQGHVPEAHGGSLTTEPEESASLPIAVRLMQCASCPCEQMLLLIQGRSVACQNFAAQNNIMLNIESESQRKARSSAVSQNLSSKSRDRHHCGD